MKKTLAHFQNRLTNPSRLQHFPRNVNCVQSRQSLTLRRWHEVYWDQLLAVLCFEFVLFFFFDIRLLLPAVSRSFYSSELWSSFINSFTVELILPCGSIQVSFRRACAYTFSLTTPRILWRNQTDKQIMSINIYPADYTRYATPTGCYSFQQSPTKPLVFIS